MGMEEVTAQLAQAVEKMKGDKRGRREDKTLGTGWLWKKRKAARLKAGLVPRVEKRRSRLPSRGSDPAER